jgi:hypothetical protein
MAVPARRSRKNCAPTPRAVAVCAKALIGAGPPVAPLDVMSNRHELHAFNYINRSYADVRRTLLAQPLRVFRDATNAADTGGPELHATAGTLDVSTEIEIELLSVGEVESPRPTTKLEISWKSTRRPNLFPTMRATVSMYPLTPTETQLELSGVYDPPLGVVGDVIDAVAMHDVARESVQRFVDDTAAYLRTA